MNPDDDILNMPMNSITMQDGELKMLMPSGAVTVSSGSTAYGVYSGTLNTINTNGTSSINIFSDVNVDDLLDKWVMNRVTVDHKVQEQELMKLKEVAPDYANEIKENLSKNIARDIVKKTTFTKKHDKDADVHHFIGRVWCFTEQEIKEFIKDIKNA